MLQQSNWYQVRWADALGGTCTLDITHGSTLPAAPVLLTPSSSPFVTEMDNDRDPMKPVRCTTGKIGIITSGGDLLSVPHSLYWRVVLSVKRRGVLLKAFSGYLKKEALDVELAPHAHEVTLTAIDDIEATKYRTFSKAGYFGFSQLFRECFPASEGINQWALVAQDLPKADDGQTEDSVFSCGYNSVLWMGDDKSCYDFLSDFCTAFGVTLYQMNAQCVFTHATARQLLSVNFSRDTGMSEAQYPEPVTYKRLAPSHGFPVRYMEEVPGKVVVKSGENDVNTDFPKIDRDSFTFGNFCDATISATGHLTSRPWDRDEEGGPVE